MVWQSPRLSLSTGCVPYFKAMPQYPTQPTRIQGVDIEVTWPVAVKYTSISLLQNWSLAMSIIFSSWRKLFFLARVHFSYFPSIKALALARNISQFFSHLPWSRNRNISSPSFLPVRLWVILNDYQHHYQCKKVQEISFKGSSVWSALIAWPKHVHCAGKKAGGLYLQRVF